MGAQELEVVPEESEVKLESDNSNSKFGLQYLYTVRPSLSAASCPLCYHVIRDHRHRHLQTLVDHVNRWDYPGIYCVSAGHPWRKDRSGCNIFFFLFAKKVKCHKNACRNFSTMQSLE